MSSSDNVRRVTLVLSIGKTRQSCFAQVITCFNVIHATSDPASDTVRERESKMSRHADIRDDEMEELLLNRIPPINLLNLVLTTAFYFIWVPLTELSNTAVKTDGFITFIWVLM